MACNDKSVESSNNNGIVGEGLEQKRISIDAGHLMVGFMLTCSLYISFYLVELVIETSKAKTVALKVERDYQKSGKHIMQVEIPGSLLCERLLSDLSKAGFSMKIGGDPVEVDEEGFKAGCQLKSKDLVLWKNP